MPNIRWFFFIFILFLFLFVGSLILLVYVVPKFGLFLIRPFFSTTKGPTDEVAYQVAAARVHQLKEKHYPSAAPQNTFDLYMPKGIHAPVPLIIWVHGGGFIGGDKSQIEEFATRLAADAQMGVVAMNYALALNAYYPTLLRQLDELYQALVSQSNPYAMFGYHAFFFRWR
ncbi:alpha/beta hydrolase [Enterococcus sp. LJL98]